jgi:hypothetical protein
MPEPISGSPDGWGLPSNSGTVVSTPAAALDAAAGMGYPVVAQLESAEVAHKTDIGGVFLDLRDSGELDRALGELMDLAGELGWPDARVRVQRYRPGLEMIVGGLRHDSFGPMVSVGLGGVFAEIVGDVVFALAPVSPDGARDMIERLGARGLLDGYRGSPAADVEALAQLISLVSRGMAGSEVSTFEINPLIWDGSEWVVVDWLVE